MPETWEKQFNNRILMRGLEYCEAEKVQITDRDESKIFALVGGSDSRNYQVKIIVADSIVVDMTCTCPYAGDGHNCKHMAAVLYAISKTQMELLSTNQSCDSLWKIILSMSENNTKKLLLTEARKNPTLSNYIQNMYGECGIDISSLKREVTAIKRRHSDRYGFIDYYHATAYASDLENFLKRYVTSMIAKQEYRSAFELICYIYYNLGKLQIDDSNGEISILADSCLLYWQEIVDKCTPDDRKFFFKWFQQHLYDYMVDYLQCHIDDFFIDNFHDPEMLRKKLKILDTIIAKVVLKSDNGFSLYSNLEDYVMKRLHVMKELHVLEEEMDTFCQKYYHLPEVRHFIVKQLLEKKEIAKAIDALKESKRIDQNFAGLAAKTSEELMQLYQQTGQTQLYQQELEDYIQKYQQYSLDYIKLLKQFYGKQEWEKKCQELLTYSTLSSIRDEFMIQEKLYKQFLESVHYHLDRLPCSSEAAVLVLDRYENILATQEPESVRDLYIDFVRKNSEHVGGRHQYRMLVKYLRKIEQYPAGRQKAKQIATEWRSLYSCRRAMMEELGQAGF